MSLISQNVPSINKAKKAKGENVDEPLYLRASEDAEDEKESVVDISRVKKRKKARKERDEKLALEQEREMEKLKNSLFGSLNPIEFGNEEEEAQGDIDRSTDFFFDLSRNVELSVYEDDAEVLEKSNEMEKTKLRKPVWVDEEEERTNVNIGKVNRLRKLRKEEDEGLITGPEYVARLRAQHAKLNPGTEWAQLDSRAGVGRYYDDESSDEENGAVLARGYEDVDGQVYHWDLRTRTCFHKAVDEGCVNGTSLCTSPNGALFAAGSNSGIVNVYNKDEFLGGKRKPIKTIENLTTKVDFLKFNNDAQILCICSSMKKNSLKLVHIPSFTVFSNWPPPNNTLHYPRCLDFSPGGGFLAIGNAAGKVLLYKLHHYSHA